MTTGCPGAQPALPAPEFLWKKETPANAREGRRRISSARQLVTAKPSAQHQGLGEDRVQLQHGAAEVVYPRPRHRLKQDHCW